MLNEILISKVRVDILRLFILNPAKSFHVRAVVREVGAEINAVRRELLRLENINLLRKRQSSNRLYYIVNTGHPFFPELLSMFGKEEGLGAILIKNLKHLGDIQFALLAKDFLAGRTSTPLDVDLFIVGKVNMELLKKLISDFEESFTKEVNYSVMSNDEFLLRKRKMDTFVTKLLIQGRVMLVGNETELVSMI